ncbi:MAG: hypothetical protein WD512_04145 [Candidatus Paceibacterota bacterium]
MSINDFVKTKLKQPNIHSYDYNNFYKRQMLYKLEEIKKKDMTYILGARCCDGVVLVSDTKVTIDNGADFAYTKKLFKPFNSVVMGAAGISGLYASFQDRMNLAVSNDEDQGINVSNVGTMSVIAENVIRNMHDTYKEDRWLITQNFNVIMGMRMGLEAELKCFNGLGTPEPTDLRKPKVIGHGEPYGAMFIKELWNEDWTMERTARLALFVIKIIRDKEIDSSVGYIDECLPQVYYIPDIVVSNIQTSNAILKDKLDRSAKLTNKELDETNRLIAEQFPIKELEKKEVKHLIDEISSANAHLDTFFKSGEFKI